MFGTEWSMQERRRRLLEPKRDEVVVELKGSDVENCWGSMIETRNTHKVFTRGRIKKQFSQNEWHDLSAVIYSLFTEQHRKQLRM